VLDKEPADVTAKDVFRFITSQRAPRRSSKIVRIEGRRSRAVSPDDQATAHESVELLRLLDRLRRDRRAVEPGAAWHRDESCTSTRARRPSSGSPHPAADTQPGGGERIARCARTGGPGDRRGNALRRSPPFEALGLRLSDLRPGERRVSITAGKGGHARSCRSLDAFLPPSPPYIETERPSEAGTDRLFLVLKQPRRGRPLTQRAGGDPGRRTRPSRTRPCHLP